MLRWIWLGVCYQSGECLHHRLDGRRFRQLVYLLLIVTGLALIFR